MEPDGRERLGRIVRETWVAFCRATGDDKPSHLAPWDELSEWDQEVDMRIAEAVLAAAAIPEAPMETDGRTFPNVAGMTIAELLEAIAVNSDMATWCDTERRHAITDTESGHLRDKAMRYYDRRVDCMREVQRRFDALAGTAP